MKDMIPKGTGNSRFLRSVSNFKVIYPTYDDFVNALVAGTLPVDFNGINEAGIQQVGTPLNKANLLTDETAAALGLEQEDPTVNEALRRLNQHLTDVEADGAKIEVVSYVGTGGYGASSPCSVTASFPPKMLFVSARGSQYPENAIVFCEKAGSSFALGGYTGFTETFMQTSKAYTSKSGNKVSWYIAERASSNYISASMQCNSNGTTYDVIILG